MQPVGSGGGDDVDVDVEVDDSSELETGGTVRVVVGRGSGRHFAWTRPPLMDVDSKRASERANPGADFIVTWVTLTSAVAVGKDRTPVTKRNRE